MQITLRRLEPLKAQTNLLKGQEGENMGSVCREGFNLFNKYGRSNFFKHGFFGDKYSRELMWKDTFGRFVCKLMGHAKTFETDWPGELVCLRCFKVIQKTTVPHLAKHYTTEGKG